MNLVLHIKYCKHLYLTLINIICKILSVKIFGGI